ncbi:MAG: hypothetical protein AAGB23_09815 [Pseudomonadota bacterium]
MELALPWFQGRRPRYKARLTYAEKRFALVFALGVTAALFTLLAFISPAEDRLGPPHEALTVFTISVDAEESVQPDPPKVDQREVLANTLEEAAPESGPLTVSPAPDLLIVPESKITLTDWLIPEITLADAALEFTQGAPSEGDQDIGPEGIKGTGGDGVAGNGLGGAGSGLGRGNQLFASWAPSMNFEKLNTFYPEDARGAGIEGHALLKCMVLKRDRVRDCSLVEDGPVGHDFGQAALDAEDILRVRVRNQVGRRVYNEWVIIETVFKPSATKHTAKSGTMTGDADALMP